MERCAFCRTAFCVCTHVPWPLLETLDLETDGGRESAEILRVFWGFTGVSMCAYYIMHSCEDS